MQGAEPMGNTTSVISDDRFITITKNMKEIHLSLEDLKQIITNKLNELQGARMSSEIMDAELMQKKEKQELEKQSNPIDSSWVGRIQDKQGNILQLCTDMHNRVEKL